MRLSVSVVSFVDFWIFVLLVVVFGFGLCGVVL